MDEQKVCEGREDGLSLEYLAARRPGGGALVAPVLGG